MRPRVIVHIATSLDGRIDHGHGDIDLFYSLISRWREDVTLSGSVTCTSMGYARDPGDLTIPPATPEPDDPRAMFVAVDSRGVVRNWGAIRASGYWKDFTSLCTSATPAEHRAYLERVGVRALLVGQDRVDLRAALEMLAGRFGARVVRVDSGGTLIGVLLRAGLVDEVSVLVHPVLVGGTSPRTMYRAPDLISEEGVVPLRLLGVEQLAGEVVWLRYDVVRPAA